jgi:hypothetical protein
MDADNLRCRGSENERWTESNYADSKKCKRSRPERNRKQRYGQRISFFPSGSSRIAPARMELHAVLFDRFRSLHVWKCVWWSEEKQREARNINGTSPSHTPLLPPLPSLFLLSTLAQNATAAAISLVLLIELRVNSLKSRQC